MKTKSAPDADWSSADLYKTFRDTEIEDACNHISKHVKKIRRGGKRHDEVYNDVLIGADTETSKIMVDQYDSNGYVPQDNIVVAWTISLRIIGHNLCTVYGAKPSAFVMCLRKIHESMSGGRTIVYFHNLPYDAVFLSQFLYAEFGHPVHQLNTKPHYPIMIEFENGIILRDSLIISQKKLERWAEDLDVEHKKAVGKWDYNLIRNQDGNFTQDEFEYIEHDTLALVECLDKIRENLHKHTYNIPITCTAIIRESMRIEGKKVRAHNRFLRIAPSYELYRKLEQMYHGGFTHCNRNTAGWIWKDVEGQDIASSYPSRILVDKVPMDRFRKIPENISMFTVLQNADNTAFCFTLLATGVKLRNPDEPMPVLQLSKCIHTVNAITDNGRILEADCVEIVLNEIDLIMIHEQYHFEKQVCFDVWCAMKDYLPRWIRNLTYQCFVDKCSKKGGDPVEYTLCKAKLNSIYGCLVQKLCKEDIVEDYESGEFHEKIFSDDPAENIKLREENDRMVFDKKMENYNSITPYYWGCWITSTAMLALMRLGACVDYENGGQWLYCDTDSVYSTKWNRAKLEQYNADMRTRMLAQGYGAVNCNGKEYWCGVAEYDSHYDEFIGLHSKCYAGRKDDGSLRITVAGVPKKGAECLKGDLRKFNYGFVFDGKTTGKLTHFYNLRNRIEIKNGIEFGNSIDLHECDYVIKKVKIGDLFNIVGTVDAEVQLYGDELLL